MKTMLICGAAAAALLTACTPTGDDGAANDGQAAQTEAAVEIPDAPAVEVANLKSITETLSSDEYEGRAPMTPAEDMTIDYIAEHMEAAGLQPGNNGEWFQEVPLVEITTDPKTADLRFMQDGKPLFTAEYGADEVVWTKRVREEVSLDDAELVFVGYGINAPEKGWNDYDGVDMEGKVAVILVNDPDYEMEGLDGPFGGRAMTYYGRWTYKYEEAARQGAAGAIIIHDTFPAAYGWQTVESSWTGAQVDMASQDDGASRVAVEGWVQKPVAERLMKASGKDLAALMASAKKKGFEAVPLGITASTKLNNTIRRQMSHNVVGVLPGTQRPEEYVLYSAHWDHVGRCKADETGDDICNGALDNASGIAGLIELGRMQAEAGAAERSMVFLAVTGEESGLLGSAYYGANPIYPLAQTVGGVNMDGLNTMEPTNDVVVVGAGKSELDDLFQPLVAAQDRRIEPETSPEKGSYYRSDHFSLAKYGVPMLYAGSGVDVVGKGAEYGRQQEADYIENRYHQPADEYDPSWTWQGAVKDLALYYQFGRVLADSERWPNWREGDEFRAIRDKSRAGAE
ncbi:Zn-dependent M28 family amino/carboxypeptidase [Pacificimonas flava]|nr:Zn-dependent M28 family amino/carboxypeptidase [Pacificimonas flava]